MLTPDNFYIDVLILNIDDYLIDNKDNHKIFEIDF